MSQGTRRKFSAEDKAAILRHHLVDKKLVSDVCAEIRDPAERNLSTHSFCRLARRRDGPRSTTSQTSTTRGDGTQRSGTSVRSSSNIDS